jgi:hypothetical protein
LGFTKCNTTKVRKDIVGDNQSTWQEEPEDPGQDIVNNQVGLEHHNQKGHMGDTQLGKLELVVSFFQRQDEEDEPSNVKRVTDEFVVCHKI